MSDLQGPGSDAQPRVRYSSLAILLGLAGAALVGGLAVRGLAPVPSQSPATGPRPIVQIVRQSTLPSIAPTVERLCPSVARVAAIGAAAPSGSTAANPSGTPGFVISSDGWLVTAGSLPSTSSLTVIFGDGRKAQVDDLRSDPVSGLSILHVDAPGLEPLSFADQSFARVGDFGFSLRTSGTGCAAFQSMVGSDFLVDALAQGVYVRLQPGVENPAAGQAFFGADGVILGVATGAASNVLLPAPIAAVIVDELIRNNPSPIASFGFRAIDFTAELANRIGEQRSRGAGVALVQANSVADKAGLRAGDIVIAVDGAPVSSASELSRALDAVTNSATLEVARGDQQLSINVARTIVHHS